MSDEAHIEAARRHAERAAPLLPWCAAAPDEVLMAKEEAAEGWKADRSDAWEKLLVFLFADGQPEQWENVAMRGLSVIRHCVPSLLTDRSLDEVPAIRKRATMQQGFRLTDFVEACEDEDFREMLRGILDYLFPAGSDWLSAGCKRIYLIARGYQPWLVQIWKERSERVRLVETDGAGRPRVKYVARKFREQQEMSYEDLARIFGEKPEKARQRWSARAQRVIRMPIESAGGKVHLQFGRSATTREKCAERARGNQHRKKTGESQS